MASVGKDSKGYRVRFVMPDGTNKTIRLSGIKKSTVVEIAGHIKELIAAKATASAIDRRTANWLGDIGQNIHDKLSNAGLVEPRASSNLGDFLTGYIKRRSDVKSGTTTNYNQVRLNLVAYFGYEKPLRSITANDAAAFREWLQTDEGQAENTLRRRCGRARQFFTAAIKSKLIDENPFDGMAVTVSGNKEKERFITEAESQEILSDCPNAEWRLIFALCRYGGLRCPSEVLALTWEDIIWDSSRIVVTSPKTAHHKGHENRVIPLFPELLKPLMEVQEQAAERTVHVVTRYRSSTQNLRTELNRIIKRAGVIPWPKPFQNLRSTRETELMETYPAHVVCRWIGNSEAVAKKHYLQVTDAHFEKAAVPKPAELVAISEQQIAEIPRETVAIQVANEMCKTMRSDEPTKKKNPAKLNVLRGSADGFANVRDQRITRPGLEPGTTEPKSVVLPLHHRVTEHSADLRSGDFVRQAKFL